MKCKFGFDKLRFYLPIGIAIHACASAFHFVVALAQSFVFEEHVSKGSEELKLAAIFDELQTDISTIVFVGCERAQAFSSERPFFDAEAENLQLSGCRLKSVPLHTDENIEVPF